MPDPPLGSLGKIYFGLVLDTSGMALIPDVGEH